MRKIDSVFSYEKSGHSHLRVCAYDDGLGAGERPDESEGRRARVPAQDDRLAAIAAAAAAVLRQTPYHVVRAGDVAAAVRLPGQAGRSAVWLYNEVHNRRVLVALAAAHAWQEFAEQVSWSPPGPIGSVTAARSAAVAALGVIVAFHRAEHPLMTQVGYGIGDISTAEKRKLAAGTGVTAPSWPDSPWGRVAAAAWNGRCDVFTDFLRPVLRACAESVTHLAEPNITESASRLSDVTFRTCLADREGPVDLLARGLAALWFERDLTRLAGALPRDLESAETALAAVARRRTDPRAEANANAVVVRILLEAGTLHRRCVGEAQRTVALWQSLAADPDGPATSGARGHDLQRLSDAASHLGLAAARFGDRRTAADAWQLSRRVADQGLGRDQSRIARADTNLAALAAETGHGEQAGTVVAGVHRTRLALLDRGPQDAAAWRRLTVTERTRTDGARLAGEATESVPLAMALLADRRDRLAEAEAGTESGGGGGGGPPRPAHGWTLVLLARAAARLGDTQRAAQCFRSVTDLAAAGVDPCHPVILTARCDEADRRTAVGDTRQAARLLAPVLDRTLLVHGRPALGDAHPLLTRARTLAERLGITVPYTLPGLDEASLDLDV